MSVPVQELRRLRSRVFYWNRKPGITRPPQSVLGMLTDLVTEIEVLNPDDDRCGETLRVPVYRVGSVAKVLGKNVQTVRQWERHGAIPDSGFWIVGRKGGDASERTAQRAYTYDQVRSIYDLFPLLDFSDHRGRQYDAFSIELWRRWLAMPDGVCVNGQASAPPAVAIERETLGWHRYIRHETTVLPTAVRFEGGTRDDRSHATLVIEVLASSLEPEPAREHADGDPETFSQRRSNPLSQADLEHALGRLVFVPFRLDVR